MKHRKDKECHTSIATNLTWKMISWMESFTWTPRSALVKSYKITCNGDIEISKHELVYYLLSVIYNIFVMTTYAKPIYSVG